MKIISYVKIGFSIFKKVCGTAGLAGILEFISAIPLVQKGIYNTPFYFFYSKYISLPLFAFFVILAVYTNFLLGKKITFKMKFDLVIVWLVLTLVFYVVTASK